MSDAPLPLSGLILWVPSGPRMGSLEPLRFSQLPKSRRSEQQEITANNCYPDVCMEGKRQVHPGLSEQPPEVMTIDELAGYLQVSKSSLYKLSQVGRVPGQKVGRHWRFHKAAIDAWLNAGGRAATEDGGSQSDER